MPENSIRDGGSSRVRPAVRLTQRAGDEPGEKVLLVSEPSGEREVGRVSADGTSILLADGRLFRVVVRGLSAPRVEVARWDVPGPYVVATPGSAGWKLERTAAGQALEGCDALESLLGAAIESLEER